MIITTWNVRGLQQPCRQPVVAEFIRYNRVDVMGLIETKLKIKEKVDHVARFMARYFPTWKFAYVMATERGKACRILLLWNPQSVELEVRSLDEQVIHTHIRCMRSRHSFNFSVVYGLHSPADRQALWDSLVTFGLQGGPYLVGGDLNAVMHVDERRGWRKPENREMDCPLRACTRLGLQDTPATGCQFTWTNGNVFSKLDRAMVNQEWLDAGFIIETTFMPAGFQTDHSPVKSKIFGDIKSYPKPFKFFNYWLSHAGFKPLLEEH